MITSRIATNRSMQEERSFSGRFPVRLPRYLHRQLSEVAREQGVSLNQFVCTAAVQGGGETVEKVEQAPARGSDRVSEEEFSRICRERLGLSRQQAGTRSEPVFSESARASHT